MRKRSYMMHIYFLFLTRLVCDKIEHDNYDSLISFDNTFVHTKKINSQVKKKYRLQFRFRLPPPSSFFLLFFTVARCVYGGSILMLTNFLRGTRTVRHSPAARQSLPCLSSPFSDFSSRGRATSRKCSRGTRRTGRSRSQ